MSLMKQAVEPLRNIVSLKTRLRTTAMVLGLVGPYWFGCASVKIEAPCQISEKELHQHTVLSDTDSPMEGYLYKLSGLYYEEWEESGLIPESFIGREPLKWQKYNAYCVRIATECQNALDPPLERFDRVTGDAVASVEVLVRFLSDSGTAAELASNQCQKGTIRIERVSSCKWER